MSLEETASKPKEMIAMTGYTPEEFYALLPAFEEAAIESHWTLEGKERENTPTIYKNSAFSSIADQLFFILIYMKQYTTQVVLGKLFGISQPKANLWIHYLLPILSSALNKTEAMPCRNMQDLQEEEASIFSHDGTERPIQRPKDNEKQKQHYSGKKKTHTVKNNILANSNCEVIFLTPTEEGKKHDKKIADESEYRLPEGSKLLQDTGFQGFSVSNVEILQPAKKPRGKELTQEQKNQNRNISTIRIRIEHVINGVKRYRIVKDKCRNWVKNFTDQVMEIACGLHNFRLRFRPWQEVKLQEI
ncbi:MAG: transposase [Candidatus Electrothrix sp. MAN1_4]|nr:transposase [Candidatus Electrothrix sp. MAN1_4]